MQTKWLDNKIRYKKNFLKISISSCWGLTENSKILQSNYPSIKNKLKKKDSTFSYILTAFTKFSIGDAYGCSGPQLAFSPILYTYY